MTLAGTRAEATRLRNIAKHVYPQEYEPSFPIYALPADSLDRYRDGETDIAVLRAPRAALDAIDRWLAARLNARRLVVLTIRRYDFMEARNSCLAEWTSFARGLNADEWLPVIVPDTNQTLDLPHPDLKGIEVFNSKRPESPTSDGALSARLHQPGSQWWADGLVLAQRRDPLRDVSNADAINTVDHTQVHALAGLRAGTVATLRNRISALAMGRA